MKNLTAFDIKHEEYCFKNYGFPDKIINHVVWCYYKFAIDIRDTKTLLLKRGIKVSHQMIGNWARALDAFYVTNLGKRPPKPGHKCYIDEEDIVIKDKKYRLWKAIDQYGFELDILIQSKRNKEAAICFFEGLDLQLIPKETLIANYKSIRELSIGTMCEIYTDINCIKL